MDPIRIGVRALFAFAALLALLRASGKRTLAQRTTFDFVVALVLGDVVDDFLWAEVPAARFVTAVGTLTLVHMAVSLACYRSQALTRWVCGDAVVVLEQGRPCRPGLRSERVNEQELAQMLRTEGIAAEAWAEVATARVEPSGSPSVLRTPWARAATRADVRDAARSAPRRTS